MEIGGREGAREERLKSRNQRREHVALMTFFEKLLTLLAYVHFLLYLCRLFHNVRNVRACIGTRKEYAKHQKYSHHRTR